MLSEPLPEMTAERVHRLRAVEALRAGVPNRDVVRYFPPHQSDVETRWNAAMEKAGQGEVAAGLLLEGDFGAGKSHWLERFEHLALENNWVCSTVVLNKETPLHDLNKLLGAAALSATIGARSGSALSEIAHTFSAERAPGYRELFDWVHGPDRDPRLALSLWLFERTSNPEVRERVITEWMGAPMLIGEFKAAIKEADSSYVVGPIPRPRRDNALEKWEFVARFFRAAGWGGWAVLLDEAEMISKYSLRQRGRSYAHLAQLMGAVKPGIPGLVCAATITKDYAGQVLYGRKNDAVTIPARMEHTRDEALAAPAIAGMRAIEKSGIDLRPPTRAQVDELFEKTRQFYGESYGWEAPVLENRREYSGSTSLREHLRWWINAWDLRRLYGHQGETIVEKIEFSYGEDADLQREKNEDEAQIVL